MFTLSWNEAVKAPKGAVLHQNGYWYTDTSYGVYLNGGGFRNGISDKPTFTGSGETLDAAIKDLEAKILSQHSKTVAEVNKKRDKALEAQVATFKAAIT